MARIQTLLIANRGEIACRVIRTARRLGIRTVAVCSSADRAALHVQLADSHIQIGDAPAAESYLRIDRILDACRRSGAQAVHPGYGFLSESAEFSRACRDAGIIFVGPSPESIAALGNKSAGKRLARSVGVPCLPGYNEADQDTDTLVAQARQVGAPLMIKAAAGGGGRGMRRIDTLDDEGALREQLDAARQDATSRSRCSATPTATTCTSVSATAPRSGATRRSSRKRPPPASARRCARPWARPPSSWHAPCATRARAPSSSCWRPTSSSTSSR
jgi:acetyl/propionyl-CoA carboxylase alpha subunit